MLLPFSSVWTISLTLQPSSYSDGDMSRSFSKVVLQLMLAFCMIAAVGAAIIQSS